MEKYYAYFRDIIMLPHLAYKFREKGVNDIIQLMGWTNEDVNRILPELPTHIVDVLVYHFQHTSKELLKEYSTIYKNQIENVLDETSSQRPTAKALLESLQTMKHDQAVVRSRYDKEGSHVSFYVKSNQYQEYDTFAEASPNPKHHNTSATFLYNKALKESMTICTPQQVVT
mmetsp:Transcript_5856/g.8584  ORF Transcript_5856/g.8584 Transcript_5856/m.8584 type:complete len:172 (+) Transcript_5856:22-537(+)